MAVQQTAGFPKYIAFFANSVLETAIWTFAELAIADHLAAANEPQTADEIAKKQGWNSEYLYRVLRAVVDADIVSEIESSQTMEPEKTNRFQLTEDGRFLTSNHPSKARYFILWESSPLARTTLFYLPQLVCEGPSKPNGFQRATNNDLFFNFIEKEENKNIAHNFNETMTSMSTHSSQFIVKSVDFGRFNTIVDIGGNFGVLLASIMEKYSTIKQGICFDLASVVQSVEANNEFEKRNIPKERYQYLAGDMFDAQTIPQADAYIMKHIIHDWDDDQAINILKSIGTAANGKPITIFIIDVVVLPRNEENKLTNQTAHVLDIHMMLMLHAKERTQNQMVYLCEQTGFRFKQLYRTETPYSIIEAVLN
ncbi:unnamed protein product [Rotaria socialis]|uniref:Acetylserotonin O-methyltransferase n=1 Tax=Rotaria socialis TaxID=392032 RepID=A0A818DTR1_9BILA|nr:unnamed protein product [Rotaria socialis]CAF4305614.1 unnamed protein product [Rotaria socialis]